MMTIDGLPRLLLSVMCNAIQHYVDNIIVREHSIRETDMEYQLMEILYFLRSIISDFSEGVSRASWANIICFSIVKSSLMYHSGC